MPPHQTFNKDIMLALRPVCDSLASYPRTAAHSLVPSPSFCQHYKTNGKSRSSGNLGGSRMPTHTAPIVAIPNVCTANTIAPVPNAIPHSCDVRHLMPVVHLLMPEVGVHPLHSCAETRCPPPRRQPGLAGSRLTVGEMVEPLLATSLGLPLVASVGAYVGAIVGWSGVRGPSLVGGRQSVSRRCFRRSGRRSVRRRTSGVVEAFVGGPRTSLRRSLTNVRAERASAVRRDGRCCTKGIWK